MADDPPEEDKPDAAEQLDYRELFLRANARPEYIAAEFAGVVRGLMRAVGSQDPSGPVAKAAYEMNHVWELVQRCKEPISFHTIFEGAVEDVRENLWDREGYHRRLEDAALDGLMYLVEASCHDNAARGRASKRYSTFQSAVEYALNDRR